MHVHIIKPNVLHLNKDFFFFSLVALCSEVNSNVTLCSEVKPQATLRSEVKPLVTLRSEVNLLLDKNSISISVMLQTVCCPHQETTFIRETGNQ